jgi:DNA-binding MarR family transcriptional regulator
MGATVKERILIHLLAYARRAGAPPPEVTQKGIAKAAGIRRSHVPRALKQLIDDGYLEESKGRVAGGRELKVYHLTERGVAETQDLADAVSQSLLEVVHGDTRREMTLAEACEAYSLRPVDVLRESRDGVLTVEPRGGPSEVGDFVDREEELALLRAWYRRGAPLMVIYGGAGYGKTALARRFLQVEGIRNAKWLDLRGGEGLAFRSPPGTEGGGRKASPKKPQDAAREMVSAFAHPLLVFDGYEDVGERTVEFFRALAQEVAAKGVPRVLILARDTTPSYCRFYGRDALAQRVVEELHLGGLDEAASKVLLRAPDIDEEAFKRIHLLTRGCPLYLKLIREEDAQELKRRSRFTNPEIRLLIFSKDVRREAG